MKKMIALLIIAAMAFSVLGCSALVPMPNDYSSSTLPKETTNALPSTEDIPRFTVHFAPNEKFADEPTRMAAERIDPIIQKAVELLNTIPETDIDVLNCDYSKRPTEKDKLLCDEKALEWCDFIYEKLSDIEDFSLNPTDYGGEEALNFPFYTAEMALMVDHRELFLYSTTWQSDDGTIYPIYFMPGDWVDEPSSAPDAIRNAVAVYDRVIDRIFEKMPTELTNYEKVCYFILVVSVATDYSHEHKNTVFSSYDALVSGKTICHGYARAFYELCRRAEISAWYCEGSVPEGFHAWNRIDTTEGTLYIDVTWYDKIGITDNYKQGCYEYLFMTQEDYEFYGYTEGQGEADNS